MGDSALAASLCTWVRALNDDELVQLEPIVLAILRARHSWARHATAAHWHSVLAYRGGSVHTRCRGRWSLSDEGWDTSSAPPSADRCPACQEAHVESRIAEIATLFPPAGPVEAGLRELRRAPVIATRPAVDFAFDMTDEPADEPALEPPLHHQVEVVIDGRTDSRLRAAGDHELDAAINAAIDAEGRD